MTTSDHSDRGDQNLALNPSKNLLCPIFIEANKQKQSIALRISLISQET